MNLSEEIVDCARFEWNAAGEVYVEHKERSGNAAHRGNGINDKGFETLSIKVGVELHFVAGDHRPPVGSGEYRELNTTVVLRKFDIIMSEGL